MEYYTTKKRSRDWIAFISKDPEKWESGNTEKEAVEKLKQSRGYHLEPDPNRIRRPNDPE